MQLAPNIVLQYPKQKSMYDPRAPPIRSKWIDDSLQQDMQHIAVGITKLEKSLLRTSISPNVNVVDRLYQKDKQKHIKIDKLKLEKESREQCTPKSFINRKSQQIVQQLHLKPFVERQNEMWQEQKIKIELQRLIEQQEQEVPLQQPAYINCRSQDQFIRDNQEWVDYRNKKQEQLRAELINQDSSTFQPRINQKSSQIVGKMRNSTSPINNTDRLSRQIKRSPLKEVNYDYSPHINKKSRILAQQRKLR